MNGTIIVDTREQDLHIMHELERRGIQCIRKKLDFGDYSFEVDDRNYEREIVIERKGSLDELIGNMTRDKKRFRNEFVRARGTKVILMVEASQGQIQAGQYRSRMKPLDLSNHLQIWCHTFQLSLVLVDRDKACETMLQIFRKHFRETRNTT